MKSFAVAVLLLIVVAAALPARSQTVFKKAIQEKYGYKSVSCYTCHKKGKDDNGKRLGKEHRNEFGAALHEQLADKNVTDRLKEAKKLDADARKQVQSEVAKEFLEAVAQLEDKKSPEGDTWGELLRDGNMEGVKMKK